MKSDNIKSIKVKSPTRVDLAGGTLDCWPLYSFMGGATTVNLAIDIFTEVEIVPNEDENDRSIVCKSLDLQEECIYKDIDDLIKNGNSSLELLRSHIAYWKPEKGFTLTAQSGSPIGGGLGGSSSLSISLIKALSQFCEKNIMGREQITLAGNIEAKLLHTPTGSQDYFPPTFSGLNIIDYGMNGTSLAVKNLDANIFKDRFFLVYTGRPHHSGLNNWDIIKSAVEKDQKVIRSLKLLQEIAAEMKNCCLEEDWELLGDLLRREFDARVQLSPMVSCPEVEKLKIVAEKAGAEAVKICGAGGGGCALVWCPEDKYEEIRQVCSNEMFEVLSVNPVFSHTNKNNPDLGEMGF